MSLINEALKKAQPQRPDSPPPSGGPVIAEPPQPQPPRRKRNYLWGFLMAVIIVGLFSALVSSYLVYQILGDGATDSAKAEPVREESAEAPAEQVWEKLPQAEMAADAPDQVPSGEPEVAAATQQATTAPAEQPAAKETEPTVEKVVSTAPAKPNPAVWARLQELEIRGIMSGGEKVLIHDLSTGKTKSYKPGDILDGSLALKIASIESDAILFEDYGGIIHTQSF